MSKEKERRFARRDVLKATAASGGVVAGVIGTAAAQEGRGPPDDRGSGRGGGPPVGRGPGTGGGGGGGTNPTGGSALLWFSDAGSVTLPSIGDTFTIVGDAGDEVTWYAGCDAVGSRARPTTYRGITVEWTSGSGPSTIYVVENRPITPGEGYTLAEAPSSCGINTTDDDIPDDRYTPGIYYRTGWEPGGEDHEE